MDNGAIDRIHETLSEAHPLAVYLFGSAAANRSRPDSDLDLAILPLHSLPLS
jgi:predicted nucleotidyltransferase